MSSAVENTVISAFTEDQVRRLTGISQRQLRYWAEGKEAFFVPSLIFREQGVPEIKLYSFRDLVCLKVLNALRNEAKVSLKELRNTKERLAHLGDDMWAKTTLYVLNRRVVFDNPETGEKEEVSTGQGVLQIPLEVVAGDMREAVRAMRESRSESAVGRIEKKRGSANGRAVIAGTRIPVSSVQEFYRAGYSVEQIKLQYPSLTKDDIRAAIDYKEVA